MVLTLDALEQASRISKCLELAILLEVSVHKPGNVSVVTNFENTRYEHFLASAVATGSSFEGAAKQGINVREGRISAADVGVGQIIRNCMAEIDSWQRGGNTLLGAVILLGPIAVAGGMIRSVGNFKAEKLRKNVKKIVESTTPEDAVNVYEAMKIAKPSGLGRAPRLDVNDPTSARKILDEQVTLFQVFQIAEKYDTICSEWVHNYPITFDLAYPFFTKQITEGADLSQAILHTFLEVLAKIPDTFIARKTSIEVAKEVSAEAAQILSLGGLETREGRQRLADFDAKLRRSSNLLNPGTTADIVAAALAVSTLGGFRP
ncbi:MAG: triphosphoribosyl-dephospho-CoA synthase [Candidatus Bathyarchaeia archaeon]